MTKYTSKLGQGPTILMKVVGEFFKPKGMTNHSKRYDFDLKVVIHTYLFSMGT
jgi:hypothetical protein